MNGLTVRHNVMYCMNIQLLLCLRLVLVLDFGPPTGSFCTCVEAPLKSVCMVSGISLVAMNFLTTLVSSSFRSQTIVKVQLRTTNLGEACLRLEPETWLSVSQGEE